MKCDNCYFKAKITKPGQFCNGRCWACIHSKVDQNEEPCKSCAYGYNCNFQIKEESEL